MLLSLIREYSVMDEVVEKLEKGLANNHPMEDVLTQHELDSLLCEMDMQYEVALQCARTPDEIQQWDVYNHATAHLPRLEKCY